ncbi:hypothetical protein COCCADRAFT_87999, partial [Bipolaris zeicola 26-R-13]
APTHTLLACLPASYSTLRASSLPNGVRPLVQQLSQLALSYPSMASPTAI